MYGENAFVLLVVSLELEFLFVVKMYNFFYCFGSERMAGEELGCGLENTSESAIVYIPLKESFQCVTKGICHTHGNTCNPCEVYISLIK